MKHVIKADPGYYAIGYFPCDSENRLDDIVKDPIVCFIIDDVSEGDEDPACVVTAADIHGDNVEAILHPSGMVIRQNDDRWENLEAFMLEMKRREAQIASKASAT